MILGLLVVGALAAVSKSDTKKFPAVSGEIYGQAAPGVKSITVNSKPVSFDANQNFRALVSLKAGEKYISLNINYEGLRITKKYLIVRRPATKKFKVYVPKEKTKEPAEFPLPTEEEEKEKEVVITKEYAPVPKRVVKPKKRMVKRRILTVKKIAKPVQKIVPAKAKAAKPKACAYQYVWEFSRGKLMVVKETRGKYSADIYVPKTQEWMELRTLSRKELKNIIENSTNLRQSKK